MQTRVVLVPWIAMLTAALAAAQAPCRLIEDLRSVRSAVLGLSEQEGVPAPLFEDPLVDVEDRYADFGGRIEGVVTQNSMFFDRYQHANTPETVQRLRMESSIHIHGEGHPAHDTLAQESRWVLRFELVQHCSIQINTSHDAQGEFEDEYRLRRLDGGTWSTLFEYVVGQPYPGDFSAVLTNVGGQYELTQINRLRGRAPAAPGAVWSLSGMTVELTPFRSSWSHWPVEQGGNDHWYRAVRTGGALIDHDVAAELAAARGGYLASVSSAAENAFVFSQVNDRAYWRVLPNTGFRNGPWLGAHQTPGAAEPAGGWAWDSGEAFVYANWAAGEPSNSGGDERFLNFYCRGCSGPAATWNDHDSAADGTFDDRPIAYVVEYDRQPCPDFDESGSVDLADVAILLATFGQSGLAPFAAGDCDGDGDVELDDLSLLLAEFGGDCS